MLCVCMCVVNRRMNVAEIPKLFLTQQYAWFPPRNNNPCIEYSADNTKSQSPSRRIFAKCSNCVFMAKTQYTDLECGKIMQPVNILIAA